LAIGAVFGLVACSGNDPPLTESAQNQPRIAFTLLEKNKSDSDPDVLSSSDTEIYVVSPDGSGLKRLTNNFEGDGDSSWSPDGSKLADVTLEGGLFVLHLDGSRPVRLADGVNAGPPGWSPNGAKLAFSRGGKLWIVRSDGGNLVHVSVKGVEAFAPVWSHDGKTIAFLGFRGRQERGTQRSGVYVMNPKSGATTLLLASSTFPTFGDPAWSPNGSKIAFQRNPPRPGLFVINADGSGVRRLTHGLDYEAQWSPDGEKIAFARYRHEFDAGGTLYLADVSTGSLFAPASDLRASEPTWSPDGTEIAFIGPVPGKRRMGELYVMSVDGTPRRIITHTGGKASEPAWTPN
jgi:TolB protein